MKTKLSLESHQWNIAKPAGKNKPATIFRYFPNKNKLFEQFDALCRQLVDYKSLINQYDLKNHQDWVDDVFAVLVNIDNIIIKHETTKETDDKHGVTVFDYLQEETDMLDEISGMPSLRSCVLDDAADEQIENQYSQVRKAIYAVHTALLEAIPW